MVQATVPIPNVKKARIDCMRVRMEISFAGFITRSVMTTIGHRRHHASRDDYMVKAF